MSIGFLLDKPLVKRSGLWQELGADLKACGWDNRKISTALRFIFLELNFQLLLLYRFQVRLDRIPIVGKFMRRILSWFTRVLTSCEISSLATLEGGVIIPHPIGIIIGEGIIIQSGVTIFQNVTIGMRSGHTNDQSTPIIHRGATIYTGAVITGKISVGENAIVGANAVILFDIPDNRTAVGVPAKIL